MKRLYIAATNQHVGKTTTCLGLVSGLMKRSKSVGFLKPIGQEHVEIDTGIHVDKDVVLFKDHFQLNRQMEVYNTEINRRHSQETKDPPRKNTRYLQKPKEPCNVVYQ